jgi:putative holliday junction resolvase
MVFWLGIDHGTKRIGVAGGNTESGIASPIKVIPAEPIVSAIARIVELAHRYRAEGIVVGLPLNMDGSVGPQAALARQMAESLAKASQLDVRLFDERLSSFEADKVLAGGIPKRGIPRSGSPKLTRKRKKARQDAVAAATMLADFFAVRLRSLP